MVGLVGGENQGWLQSNKSVNKEDSSMLGKGSKAECGEGMSPQESQQPGAMMSPTRGSDGGKARFKWGKSLRGSGLVVLNGWALSPRVRSALMKSGPSL